MDRYKYDKTLSLGCIASAGTFAAMIPPSNLFIIYAILTDQSIAKLFAAGMLPGILTAFIFALLIIYRVKKNPKLAPRIDAHKTVNLKQRIIALKELFPLIILATIVLGHI